MNPELQRNLWLEISPTRLTLMGGVLALILWIASLAGTPAQQPALAGAANFLFFVIVAVWGCFKCARAVADEIRDHTWDFQRMSALSPDAMTIGKLFGATAYVWVGGAICLLVLLAVETGKHGVGAGAYLVLRLGLLAVLAHAVALAASLAGARRRRGSGRGDSFLYMLAGLAAWQLASVLSNAPKLVGVVREFQTGGPAGPSFVSWWNASIPGEIFILASLALFALLAAGLAWRLMSAELQAPAHPALYAFFVGVVALWVAGLGMTPIRRAETALLLAQGIALATFWIEPKDVVGWRALAAALKAGRGREAAALWPASATAIGMTAIAAIAVVVTGLAGPPETRNDALAGPAFLAFLIRDALIFVFFHLGDRQRRGDFAAVLTIALLYGVPPTLFSALDLKHLIALFAPSFGKPLSNMEAIASACVQIACIGLAVRGRWTRRAQGLAA